MAPRPLQPGPYEPDVQAGSGRFHPDIESDRWDDLREPQISFLYHRTWVLDAPTETAASFRRRITEDGKGWGELSLPVGPLERNVRLLPTDPIPIPEPFDTLEIALKGMASHPGKEPLGTLRLLLEDAEGEQLSIPVGPFFADSALRQRHLGPSFLQEARFPFRFLGMEIEKYDPAPFRLQIGDIVFYPQSRGPLSDRFTKEERPRPKRTVRMAEHLTGPSAPEPIPPTPPAEQAARTAATSLLRLSEAVYAFTYSHESGIVEYRVQPERADFQTVLLWNGQPVAVWPGLRITLSDGSRLPPPLAAYRRDETTLMMEFPGNIRGRITLAGPSLSIRLWGDRSILRLEAASLPPPFHPIAIPFLNDGPMGIASIFAHTEGLGLFASLSFDPHTGHASRRRPDGGVLYETDTDGRLPPFDEQVYLTVSDVLQPLLPPPPAWVGGPATPYALPEAEIWIDNGNETVLTGTGPGAAPAWIREALADDATLPGEPGWTRDALLRDPHGHWVEGPTPNTYRRKPFWVRAALRAHAEADPWSPDVPVLLPAPLSAFPPWAFTDHDARTDRAGSFRKGWEEVVGLFHDIAQATGCAVVGNDDYAWWYAGGLNGWRLGAERGRRLFDQPFLPQMSQRVLRPHGQGIGLGPPENLLGAPDEGRLDPTLRDRYLAVHLAYGLILRLPPPAYGLPDRARLHALARAVQTKRARSPLTVLAYGCESRLCSLEQAWTAGREDAFHRLYLRYENGLELWINGSRHSTWTVQVGPDRWALPPSGWLAESPNLRAFVALREGRTAAYARTPEFTFWDGADQDGAYGGVGGAGCLALRVRPGALPELEAWDYDGTGRFRFELMRFGLPEAVLVEAIDLETGAALESATTETRGPWLFVHGPARPARYRFAMPLELPHPEP